MLKHTPPPQRGFFAWFNRRVDALTRGFGHAVEFVIRRMAIALALLVFFVWSIYHLLTVLPTSFVPNEDQGYVMAAIVMPEAASLDRTQSVAEEVDAIFAHTPGVDKRTMVTGYSLIDAGYKTNAGTFFVTLKDFKTRYGSIAAARRENARAVLLHLYSESQHVHGGVVIPVAPPPIPGIGTTGGFEFWIEDRGSGDPARLDDMTQQFLAKARARPELATLNTTYSANTQQLRADVDRSKATLLGVPVQDVYSALQAQFGSLIVSQYNESSRVWSVILQSDAKFRQDPSDLTRLYVRSDHPQAPTRTTPSAASSMVPLSALVSTHWVSGPDLLPHFNGFPAAKIIGTPAPGYSSGQAIAAMEDVAHQVLTDGYAFAWSGLAYEEKKSGGTSALAFVFGFCPGLPRARRAVRVVVASRRGDDRGAVRHPRGATDELVARSRKRRVFPDRPAGPDRPRREKRRASRVGGRRVPKAGKVDHGSDGAGRRAAIAADHHDLAGLRFRRAAARGGARRRRERTAFDRHRDHRRHDRRDDARHAVRPAVLLPVRSAARAQGGCTNGRRRRVGSVAAGRARGRLTMRKAGVACVAAVLAAGCAIAPYTPPTTDAPAKFRFEPKSAEDTAATKWWRRYDDPVLAALVAEALANNRNVKIAAANVLQASALLTQTRAPLFPQIGYSATGQRAKAPDAGIGAIISRTPNAQTSYEALLSVSWELDFWGRIRYLSEASLANVLASEDARDGVILSLVASVAGDYIQLRGLDQQLVIARQTLDTYAASVKLFELQFKYGQISQMTVAQAQSQYETAAAQIPLIESQIAQMENALSILLARNPQTIARGKTIDQLVMPPVPAGVPSQLLERRPDLQQSEQQLVAADAQIGAAKALYFPTISLTGAFGAASRELSSLFTGPARVWSYAGEITGPIFTAGLVRGQVAQAEAAQQAALLNYQQSIQNAFADVDNALIATQKLAEQLAAQQKLVAALKDYSRLATLQYNGGYAPYSTVLQAQQSLFPAELTLANIRASMLASSVNLYKAMGGGWVGLARAMTSADGQAKPAASAE